MPETLLAVAILVAGAVGLVVLAIRFGILLGGWLAKRVDPDAQEEDGRGPAS
jgi:hypothetical protein